MSPNRTLAEVCRSHRLTSKRLLAPSLQVAHQWIEQLARDGHAAVNLFPATVVQLAMEWAAPLLADSGRTLANRALGPLVVQQAWSQLDPRGYFASLAPSAGLSSALFESLRAVRLAGGDSQLLRSTRLGNERKQADLVLLAEYYEDFLRQHALVDEADVLDMAIAYVQEDPLRVWAGTVVLLPEGWVVTGLQRRLLDAVPVERRLELQHPARPADDTLDVRRLRYVGVRTPDNLPRGDGSVTLCRAVGEVNEVRAVLRRCLAGEVSWDEVELLHTDTNSYLPIIHALSWRYTQSQDAAGPLPVTFAEGLPVTLCRTGKSLAGWLRWVHEGYPQRLIVEMLHDGLIECGDDADLSYHYLARLLRCISIGGGIDNYLPALRRHQESWKRTAAAYAAATPDDLNDHDQDYASWLARKRKGLRLLARLFQDLADLASALSSDSVSVTLQAAETFLAQHARVVNQFDHAAQEAIGAAIRDCRLWLDRMEVDFDVWAWLAGLPQRLRVLASGPRPGHLHVASINTGGHSGRKYLAVVGLDDRRFPGAMLQDPVLLDLERERVSADLATSRTQLGSKLVDVSTMLARARQHLVLSWPCYDVLDDRELFPSSYLVNAYRVLSGDEAADLESLNRAAGAAEASFAPLQQSQVLDESDQWIWQLRQAEGRGVDRRQDVYQRYSHLNSGNLALHHRSLEFGSYNGHVPQAGEALDPTATAGPVLSASALELAGRCPLAYFFRYALHLYPPEDLELDPDRWLNPAQLGSLAHEVFRQFMSDLAAQQLRPDFERDHQRLATCLQAAVQRWRDEVAAPNENAFRTQYWQLVRICRIFLQEEEEFCQASDPQFFEVALGTEPVGEGTPLDDRQPARLSLPSGGAVRVKGQVDRVDRVGEHRYAVWDYKISSGHGFDARDPFVGGRRVQSVLYLRMIERALRAQLTQDAVVESFGYFFPSTRALGQRLSWTNADLQAGNTIVQRLCALIAAGSYLATDEADDCRFCDYVQICRDPRGVAECSQQLLASTELESLCGFREVRHES